VRGTRAAIAALVVAALASACGDGEGGGGDAAQAAALRGRTVYKNVCIACHAADPTQEGAVGPALAGSSRELLRAKVLKGEYPPGYEPRRGASAAMPRFEYLAGSIDDLAAYLAQEAGAGSQAPAPGTP
jgi:mono/diheme cytochrome c family protein